MPTLNQSLHLVAAVIVVTIQLVAQPIFFGIFGSTTSVESLILISVMSGICLGQLGCISLFWSRLVILISGLVLVSLGVIYSEILLVGSQSFISEMISGALVFFIVVSSGILSSRAIYLDYDIKKNYFIHNLLSILSIIVLMFIQIVFGNSIVCLVSGIFLIYISFRDHAFSSRNELLKVSWNAVTLTSLGLGLISGIYLSTVFELMELSIFPSGFEFHFYLFITFAHLAIARYLPFKRINLMFIPVLSSLVLLFVLIIYIGGINNSFIFDSSLLTLLIKKHSFDVTILSFIQIFFYMLPYVFYASVVPERQMTHPKENHLFFVSFGNFLGFLIPGYFLNHPPLEYLLPFMFFISILWLVWFGKKQTFLITFFILVFGYSLFFLIDQPTKRILVQSTHTKIFLTESINQDQNFNGDDIKNIFRKDGKVGFVYEYGGIPGIGLGGYIAPMYSFSDLSKAYNANEIIKKRKTKRILILGLGNHLLLKNISILNEIEKKSIEQIDVVDNFPAYESKGFLNDIRKVIDLKNEELTAVNFINDDVFNFLVKRKYQQPYDLIINNLTWPLYVGSRLTYTDEFLSLVKSSMTNTGIYLTRKFPDDRINCLTKNAFVDSSYGIDYLGAPVLIGSQVSNLEIDKKKINFECEGRQNLTLSNLFWGQLLYKRRVINNRPLAKIAVLIVPISGELSSVGSTMKKAIDIFEEMYGKKIIVLNSGSSNIFANFLFNSINSNAHIRERVLLYKYESKDFTSYKLLDKKTKLNKCLFMTNYKERFEHAADDNVVSMYKVLLSLFNLQDSCYLS